MLNKAILIGNVGAIKYSEPQEGKYKHVQMTVMCDSSVKKSDGTFKTYTESLKVEAWGVLAELVDKFVKVGFLVSIDGANRSNMYFSGGQKRKYSYILAKTIKVLAKTGKEEAESGGDFDLSSDPDGEFEGMDG